MHDLIAHSINSLSDVVVATVAQNLTPPRFVTGSGLLCFSLRSTVRSICTPVPEQVVSFLETRASSN